MQATLRDGAERLAKGAAAAAAAGLLLTGVSERLCPLCYSCCALSARMHAMEVNNICMAFCLALPPRNLRPPFFPPRPARSLRVRAASA